MKSKPPRASEPIEVPAGVITAITASARAPGRFDVCVGGDPVARLGIQGVERLKLRIGLDVDDKLAAEIANEATVSRAYDRAMMMLAARGRASGELKRLLVRKGEDAKVVAAVTQRPSDAGVFDDDAVGRQIARSQTTKRAPRGRNAKEVTPKRAEPGRGP